MKRMPYSLLMMFILFFVIGCGTQSVSPTKTLASSQVPTANNGYPVAQTSVQGGYPVATSNNNPYPAAGTQSPTSGKPFVTDTPDPSKTPVIISQITHNNGLETIILKNISTQSENVANWMVYNPADDAKKVLPLTLTLSPDETYELYNGVTTNKPAAQIWLDKMIFMNPGDEIWLLNQAGRVMFTLRY